MHLVLLSLSSVSLALLVYSSLKLASFFYRQHTSSIKSLPGPKSKSWIYGNFKEIWDNVLTSAFVPELRLDFVCRRTQLCTKNGYLLMDLRSNINPYSEWVHVPLANDNILSGLQNNRLFTMDTKALAHVLMNAHIYEKPEPARYNLIGLLGEGKGSRQNSKFSGSEVYCYFRCASCRG